MQSCPTFCDPMGCSLSGSSICRILQVRIPEWVAIPFSRGSSILTNWTQVSHSARRFFTVWATREAHWSPYHFLMYLVTYLLLLLFLSVSKNWYFWTMVLEKTFESLLDSKEIKSVSPKGNQPWIFIGRTDAWLKLQHFGHLMWNTDSLEKTLMLEKIEGRRRRGQ